jgi:chaperonin GroES
MVFCLDAAAESTYNNALVISTLQRKVLTQISHFHISGGNQQMAKIKPLGDKVLVQPNTGNETTAGGIVLPDSAKERPQEGKVIAVGPGRTLDNGEKAAINVKEGDTVVYSKYGGTEIKLDGEEYLILDESSLLAVKES